MDGRKKVTSFDSIGRCRDLVLDLEEETEEKKVEKNGERRSCGRTPLGSTAGRCRRRRGSGGDGRQGVLRVGLGPAAGW